MPKIIPFGNRILVKRRKIGEKLGKEGLILAPQQIEERDTDLADVVYIPDLSLADKALIDNAEKIINALIITAQNEGVCGAVNTLIEFNNFLKKKAIKVGDGVLISKYVGTTFYSNKGEEDLTIVNEEDIMGLIVKEA